MNQRAVLPPLLHTPVEERAGLPAVSPVKAGERRVLLRWRFMDMRLPTVRSRAS
jgi:hypothetical protein